MQTFKIITVLSVVLLTACGVEAPTSAGTGRVISVDVVPDSATIVFGDTIQVTATVIGQGGIPLTDKVLTWESTDTTTATVDSLGLVIGVRGGIAGIVAIADDVSGRARITVLGRVASVMVSPDDFELLKGNTLQLEAIVRDRAGNRLTGRTASWESSSDSVATVSSTGIVTAMEEGSATITATVEGRSGTASLLIKLPIVFNQLSAGGNHTCGAGADSTGYCWGAGGSGQLGQPGGSRNTPGAIVSVFSLKLLRVSAGGAHTCAIDESGAAWCWGSNSNGQVGGSADDPDDPVMVGGGLTFVSSNAGGSHSCGVTTGNGAYCWGLNDRGQVGDQTNTDRLDPVQVFGGLSFAQISAGGSHTCGVTTADVAYCWGLNDSGQLGDGSNTNSSEPVAVIGGSNFTQIGAGASHTCGLATTGDILCWGANDQGQLGDGSTTDRTAPVTVSGNLSFDEVAAGGSHTCAVVLGETAYCWGQNSSGQLGNGGTAASSDPVRVSDDHDFESITAGASHSCGLTSQPLAYCWGRGNQGQLGGGPVDVSGFGNTPTIVIGQQ